jgi:hypothetical protein
MNTTNPSTNLDAAINDRVAAAVRSHRIKIRVLTSVAFLFGFLTVAASVCFVWCYLIVYLPKQRQMLQDAKIVAQQAKTGGGARGETVEEAIKRIDNFLGVQITMTHVVSMGTTVVAIVVGILGSGTLVLLTVVVLNRRAALNQINASLAQISDQLREWQTNQNASPPAR